MKTSIQDSRRPEGCRVVDLNRRKAIAEYCLQCGGFEYSARKNCVATDCDLYPYRMGSGKQDPSARMLAIRTFCREFCMCGNARYVKLCTSLDCALYAFRRIGVDKSACENKNPPGSMITIE